jgi:GH35 family endo-1,4-beta-xylanase
MFLRKMLVLIFICFGIMVSAQTLPTGQRLKDINPAVLVGCVLQTGYADTKSVLTANTPIQNIFKREFNLGQATCYPAWDTWTGLKTYKFTEFNNSVNWFVANNVPVVAHLLAGQDTYFPDWFKTGTYSAVELDSILVDYIRAVIRTNNNFEKVDYWNVVNESLWWNGYYYNTNATDPGCKLQNMGYEPDMSGIIGADRIHTQHPVYIRKAFEYARRYTNKKLELRDYGAEFWGDTKTKTLYQLARHLKNSGAPIDAVGLQCHFDLAKTYDWNKFKQTITEYKRLGLEVYLTEVDFADKLKLWTPAKAEIQKQLYKSMTKAAVEAGVNWICVWGVRDNWNQFWLLDNSPLLFANDLTPKSAYYGVQEGLSVSTAIPEVNLKKVDNSLQVFPNPAKNSIKILLKESLTENCKLNLLNSTGKGILNRDITSLNGLINVDLPNSLSAGVYYVQVSSQISNKNWTSKLIIN